MIADAAVAVLSKTFNNRGCFERGLWWLTLLRPSMLPVSRIALMAKLPLQIKIDTIM
jgi:hypothetical protein